MGTDKRGDMGRRKERIYEGRRIYDCGKQMKLFVRGWVMELRK
jgi:hypothetical protein